MRWGFTLGLNVKEVGQVAKKISMKSAAAAAVRSTKASAKLVGRVLTTETKSAATGRFVTAHPARTK